MLTAADLDRIEAGGLTVDDIKALVETTREALRSDPVAWAVVGSAYPSLPDEDERIPAFFTQREAERHASVVGGDVRALYGHPPTLVTAVAPTDRWREDCAATGHVRPTAKTAGGQL